jgi:hypothetical protein
VGIAVTEGTLDIVNCTVQSEWPEHFVGLKAAGEGTRAILDRCRFDAVATGIHFTDRACGQAELTTVNGATHHAVVIDHGADPQLVRCELEGGDISTLLIADDGKGSVGDCTLRAASGATIEIRSGGSPSLRGSVVGGASGASASSSARVRLERFVERDRDRAEDPGWKVRVLDGGRGWFRGCHVANLETVTGGAPELEGCRIDVFDAHDGGLGTVSNSVIGSVTISSGANPLIKGGCRIHPDLGRTIAVTVADGGLGTIEDSEIVGIDVERRVDDPAVLITTDGNPTLVRCVITGPEVGTVRVANHGRGRIERCEVSTDARNGPAVQFGATRDTFTITESKLHGGAAVAPGAVVHLEGCEIDAPKMGGVGLSVLAGGEAHVRDGRIQDIATRGVVVAGTVTLTGCEIRSTGASAILVEGGGSLVAEDCTVGEAGRSAAQRVGRRLGAFGDKIKDRAEKLVGPSQSIAVQPRGAARFTRCTIDDDRDDAIDVPPESVVFDDCTLNGSPYAGPMTVGE